MDGLNKIILNSSLTFLDKMVNGYSQLGDKNIIPPEEYARKTVYSGQSYKTTNMGFLVHSNYDHKYFYPHGASVVDDIFSFTIGESKNEQAKITVDMGNNTVTGINLKTYKKVTWNITPDTTDSASATIWTFRYDSENHRISIDKMEFKSAREDATWKKEEIIITWLQNPRVFTAYHEGYADPEQYIELIAPEKKDYVCNSPVLSSSVSGYEMWPVYYDYHTGNTRLSYATAFSSARVEDSHWLNFYLPDDKIIDDDKEKGGYPALDPQTPIGPGTYPDDDTPIPALPTISVVDTGFISLYNPTLAEVKSLANYMWSDAFSLDSFKKLFADPMETIIGLSILPCNIPDGGRHAVTVGNHNTGILMTLAQKQWVEVDCGTIAVNSPWTAYPDYSPHTKISIFLPYIGINSLHTDDIVGSNLHVVYHIDILSGSLVCFLSVIKGGHERILYSYNGQCAINIPLSSINYASMMQSCIEAAVTAGGIMAGSPTALAKGTDMVTDPIGTLQSFKPEVQRSGSYSQSCGLMGYQKPYLIFERPDIRVPANYESYRGISSQITSSIGTSKGYTVVDDINLSGLSATDAEKDEIISLLKGGVIV